MAELLRRGCELCELEASVYCPSDSAYLCAGCDEKVHCANFLVARHVRVRVCPHCRNHAGKGFSGVRTPPAGSMKVACISCSPQAEEVEEDCLSSSSSCVSSTGEENEVGAGTSSFSSSSRRKRRDGGSYGGCKRSTPAAAVAVVAVDMKVEGVLVNWCRRMGVEDGRVVKMAVELLGGCLGKMTSLPFRVSLAAAFWVAIRLCCDGGSNLSRNNTCHELRRLEQISGVPAKLIVATESRLARVIKRRQLREDHEEGWAES